MAVHFIRQIVPADAVNTVGSMLHLQGCYLEHIGQARDNG